MVFLHRQSLVLFFADYDHVLFTVYAQVVAGDGLEHAVEAFTVDEGQRVGGLARLGVRDEDLHVENTFELRGDLVQRLIVEIEPTVAPREIGFDRRAALLDRPGYFVILNSATL